MHHHLQVYSWYINSRLNEYISIFLQKGDQPFLSYLVQVRSNPNHSIRVLLGQMYLLKVSQWLTIFLGQFISRVQPQGELFKLSFSPKFSSVALLCHSLVFSYLPNSIPCWKLYEQIIGGNHGFKASMKMGLEQLNLLEHVAIITWSNVQTLPLASIYCCRFQIEIREAAD